MKAITFVCLGNICRSPIAQGCATKLAKERGIDMIIDSAGTGSWHIGEAPCENSIKIAASNHIDISTYRATQFQKKDIQKYDLIIALDENNFQDLKALGTINVVKLGDYGFNSQDVPDPYFFRGFEGFEKVFSMIDVCVENLFEKEGF